MDGKPSRDNFSWWTRRTRIEKCSLFAITLCCLCILYLASNLFMKFPSDNATPSNVCMTEKCIRSAANILDKMDRKVNPCEDFYKFVCGNFVKTASIPDDKTQISSFSSVGDKVQLDIKKILEEPIQESDSRALRLVKTIYETCMNISRIENESHFYLVKTMKEIGGWPALEDNWNERSFDWKKVLYRFRKLGWRQNAMLTLYITEDPRNSTNRMISITQPCLNYESLKRGLNDTSVQATYQYLIKLTILFGVDREHATMEMREVIEFEMKLAKIMIPYANRKNATLEYNPITIRELQKQYPSIPWLQFINVYLAPVDMFTADDIVNVALPKFISNLENLLLATHKRVLANYLFTRVIRDFVPHLPEKFRNKQIEYFNVLYGKSQATPRWKICISEASRLNVAVSSIYVKNFFNKHYKNKVTELVLDVKGAFLDTLRKIGWMDRKTKKHAILKAEKMNSLIAYPDEILDDAKVDAYYEDLVLNPEEYYLKMSCNVSLFMHRVAIRKLREPNVKLDWTIQAYSFYVNAFYDQNANAIDLPAAILQDSFFDPDRPQYMNYGSIGEVIGHEISHGFDDHGRQYDKDGNLIDWWEPETNRTFSRKSQCLVEQYENYSIPHLGLNLSGVNNLAENIADNGGIKIAYRGYLKWMERNKAEPMLPGLNFSPRQMFWISAASNWCTKYKKEALKQLVRSGYHAPNYFRVVVPFMNSDNFGRDFNCQLGTAMNPKYKCRIW